MNQINLFIVPSFLLVPIAVFFKTKKDNQYFVSILPGNAKLSFDERASTPISYMSFHVSSDHNRNGLGFILDMLNKKINFTTQERTIIIIDLYSVNLHYIFRDRISKVMLGIAKSDGSNSTQLFYQVESRLYRNLFLRLRGSFQFKNSLIGNQIGLRFYL